MSAGQKDVVTAAEGNPWGLTDAELRVVRLLPKGLTYKEIAREIGCSHRTVEKHGESAKPKMGAKTLTHAAVLVDRWEFERAFVGMKGDA